MAKDERMHGVIRKRDLQDTIRERMRLEDLTFEEMIEKYLTFPENVDDTLQMEYAELQKKIAHVYGKPGLKGLMDVFWIMIYRCAKEEYDIEKILHNLKSDISLQTYKKR